MSTFTVTKQWQALPNTSFKSIRVSPLDASNIVVVESEIEPSTNTHGFLLKQYEHYECSTKANTSVWVKKLNDLPSRIEYAGNDL